MGTWSYIREEGEEYLWSKQNTLEQGYTCTSPSLSWYYYISQRTEALPSHTSVYSQGGRCFHLSILLPTGTCQKPTVFQSVVAATPDSCEFCVNSLLRNILHMMKSSELSMVINIVYVCKRRMANVDVVQSRFTF